MQFRSEIEKSRTRGIISSARSRIFKIILSAAWLVSLTTNTTMATTGTVEQGWQAVQNGQHQHALKIFRELASQGNAIAENNIGYMYEKGFGVNQDFTEAFSWYERSANKGHGQAQINIGLLYSNGRGVPADLDKAIYWFRKAAEKGLVWGQYNLAGLLAQQYRWTEAISWYEKAADQNLVSAQINLGVIYMSGLAVEQDLHRAENLFLPGAKRNIPIAHFNLGLLYRKRGDLENAYKWYNSAAELGDRDAQFTLAAFFQQETGVVKLDRKRACEWYLKAAQRGHATAQLNVGACYYWGTHFEKNHEEAKRWLRKSASNGEGVAIMNLRKWFDEEF